MVRPLRAALSALAGWLRASPLLRFALLGAALFALDAWRARGAPRPLAPLPAASIREALRRERGRAPSALELLARERELIRDEVLYRHALALGLDRGDDIVRRRLVQKAMYLLEAQAEPPPPTESELRAWIAAHPSPDRAALTLEHRYYSSDPTGVPDAGEGQSFLRGERFESRTRDELDAIFGEGFSSRLTRLPQHQWAGPIQSAHGWHRVRWYEVVAPQGDRTAHGRAAAERAWRDEARALRVERAVRELVARYQVAPR